MAKDILIIDSDKRNCKALYQYCNNMGCFNNIIFAHDGTTAINKLDNQKFHIVLIAIDLPKRSGIDILKDVSINKRPLNSPSIMIVMAESFEKEIVAKVAGFGCKNFLVKPVEEANFQEKVLKVLQMKPGI